MVLCIIPCFCIASFEKACRHTRAIFSGNPRSSKIFHNTRTPHLRSRFSTTLKGPNARVYAFRLHSARLVLRAAPELSSATKKARVLDHEFAAGTRVEQNSLATHKVRCHCTLFLHARRHVALPYAPGGVIGCNSLRMPPILRSFVRVRKLGS